MGSEGEAWPQLEKIIQLATVAIAAEQMGGSQQLLDSTVEYTKERVQFGRPVAGFQAVKHKAADMMLKTEVSRSAVYYAACIAEEAMKGGELAGELAEAASVAKAYCSDAYFQNAGDAIQLHGGVGFTWEYDVHLYFKRAKSSEIFLGNGAYHREKVAQLLLDS
jgi:alkylation response protein AidB-like acyl-CoA dehydrogenase